ncbi:zinc finger protein [Actinopolyspora halophila]|uniref:zinc finger protein n=1 Tax=Actinopolyspora halophila TaxID=1850 RepID=UPI0003826EEA|nr:zinc finger protein [Actinopolyspora halophila]
MHPEDHENRTRFWHPVRRFDGKRHVFHGNAPGTGWRAKDTLCGLSIDPAPVSSTEWLLHPTCPDCWEKLVHEQIPDFPSEAPLDGGSS